MGGVSFTCPAQVQGGSPVQQVGLGVWNLVQNRAKSRPKPREHLTLGSSQPGAKRGRTQKTTKRTLRAVVFPNPGRWAAGRRAPGTAVAYKAAVTRVKF